jgi:hypothetical protein
LASAASTLSPALTSEMSFNPPNSSKIVAEPAKQAFGNGEVLVEKGCFPFPHALLTPSAAIPAPPHFGPLHNSELIAVPAKLQIILPCKF